MICLHLTWVISLSHPDSGCAIHLKQSQFNLFSILKIFIQSHLFYWLYKILMCIQISKLYQKKGDLKCFRTIMLRF